MKTAVLGGSGLNSFQNFDFVNLKNSGLFLKE